MEDREHIDRLKYMVMWTQQRKEKHYATYKGLDSFRDAEQRGFQADIDALQYAIAELEVLYGVKEIDRSYISAATGKRISL